MKTPAYNNHTSFKKRHNFSDGSLMALFSAPLLSFQASSALSLVPGTNALACAFVECANGSDPATHGYDKWPCTLFLTPKLHSVTMQ